MPNNYTAYLARYPIVGPAEIAALFGVVRQRAYQITRSADFPAPIAELAKGGVWDTKEVLTWAGIHKRETRMAEVVAKFGDGKAAK